MTIFRNLFNGEKRSISYQDVWGRGLDIADGASTTGQKVTPQTAQAQVTVMACVRLLAESVAQLPVDRYRKKPNGDRQSLGLPVWLSRPNPEMTRFEFIEAAIAALALWGNSYNLIVRSETGEILELWPLDPSRVMVTRDAGHNLIYVIDGQMVPADSMLHIKAMPKDPGSPVGQSLIEAHAQAIGLALATEEHGARFFGSGATFSGLIELPGDATEDVISKLKQGIAKFHGGTKNSHKPMVLTNGAQWKNISISGKDSQFLETRMFERDEICTIFRVPLFMLGNSEKQTSWGTGVEQMSIAFVRWSLLPWLRRLEEHFDLLLPRGQYVRFNTSGVERGDTGERYEAHTKAITNGFMTRAEVRQLEDLPFIEGTDDLILPLNLAVLDGEEDDELIDDPAVVDQLRHSDDLTNLRAEIQRLNEELNAAKAKRKMRVVRDKDGFAIGLEPVDEEE